MSIPAVVRRVARLLKATQYKIVFAESCTGGLVSGSLTAIPGISQFHCGGMVVYRNETKTEYLGIVPRVLQKFDAVSARVAKEMARRILDKTPEANIAASVTGHLGPDAPRALDGLVFVGVALRGSGRRQPQVTIHELHCRRRDSRTLRQRWVVEQVLNLVANALLEIHSHYVDRD